MQPTPPAIAIEITPATTPAIPGKLADAAIHFLQGPLAGLKLIGFSIWERRTGNGRNVTFPARQYSVNGERRSFALLRPSSYETAGQGGATLSANQERIRDLILDAFEHSQAETPDAGSSGARFEYDAAGRYLPPIENAPDRQNPPEPQAQIGFLQQAAQAIRENPRIDAGTVIASAIAQATSHQPTAGPMPARPRRF